MASLYSETEIQKASERHQNLAKNTPNVTSRAEKESQDVAEGPNRHLVSAETIALSLLSRFRGHQLPRASDVTWLVQESDVPQKVDSLFRLKL